MDKDKLKAFLEGQRELDSGYIFGLPVGSTVPSADEVESMPDDIKEIVMKAQLKRAGTFTPAARSKFGYDEIHNLRENQERMADELGQFSREEIDLAAMAEPKMKLLNTLDDTDYYNKNLMEAVEPERFQKIKQNLKSTK